MTAGTTPSGGAAPQTNGAPSGGPAAASASTDRNLLYIEGGRLIDGVIAGVFDKLGIARLYAKPLDLVQLARDVEELAR